MTSKFLTLLLILSSFNSLSLALHDESEIQTDIVEVLNNIEGLGFLPPPTLEALKNWLSNPNVLEKLLSLIDLVTGVDLGKILLQLQSTVDGSVVSIQRAVQEVEDVLDASGFVDIIVQNVGGLMSRACAEAARAVSSMLELLLWILSISEIQLPLQAVILVIAVFNTAAPAFLQELLAGIVELIQEQKQEEIFEKVGDVLEKLMVQLRAQVELLLELLRPLIPGLPPRI